LSMFSPWGQRACLDGVHAESRLAWSLPKTCLVSVWFPPSRSMC
jgi:hypothetical protein